MEIAKSNPYLPPEILDHIIDLLRENWETLKQCCLVSRSWVPRTQEHLFAHVEFKSEPDYDKWKKAFPDPIGSPAYHAHTLTVDGSLRGAEDSGWIQGFSRVERLIVAGDWAGWTTTISLFPFHRLAPSLKSLRVSFVVLWHSQILDLVRSLPLLEDLTLSGHEVFFDDDERDGPPVVASPSTSPSPALTGTLDIFIWEGVGRTLSQLLDLPGGCRFRKVRLPRCVESDLPRVVELVAACSDTLEHLEISRVVDGTLAPPLDRQFVESLSTGDDTPTQISLSNATKLKEIVFWCSSPDSGWVTATLQTITPEHWGLQQISIRIPYAPTGDEEKRETIERIETAKPGMRWSDLDRLLVQLWESRLIRPKIVYPPAMDGIKAKDWASYLLPETTRRGTIDLVS